MAWFRQVINHIEALFHTLGGTVFVKLSCIAALLALLLILSFGCQSSQIQHELVAIGDSITMGVQDAGLVKDYQLHSYPYLIARQMGVAASFEQPYISPPGFGVPPYQLPLRLEEGRIIAEYFPGSYSGFSRVLLMLSYFPLFENWDLPRPYNNLGVGGARLHDVRSATSYSNSSLVDNYMFDIVLRNDASTEEQTILDQTVELSPRIILLWIGNNDILGAVLAGGDETLITDRDAFRDELDLLVSELQSSTDATIFIANIPGYISIAYALDEILQVVDRYNPSEEVPVLFDYETYQPLSFGGGDYLPLITEEQEVAFVLIPGIILSMEDGTGLPDSQFLTEELGYSSTEASGLLAEMSSAGLNTTGTGVGTVIPGDLTITESEMLVFIDAVDEFNVIIEEVATMYGVPLVDMHRLWDPDQPNPFGGYSGEFVFDDPEHTIFSLDGVHPNNLGHALIANVFISKINETLGENIPELNTEEYAGQYAQHAGLGSRTLSLKALQDVSVLFGLQPSGHISIYNHP
jgi:lysophospholipase L1-like esterase